MEALTEDVAELLAIASARMDSSGVLLQANAGFLRLLGIGAAHAPGADVKRFFIQPAFVDLAVRTHEQGSAYRGLLTLGEAAGQTRTLRGRVWRNGSELRLLAEFDVEELERVTERALELNDELNLSQRALAQANLMLKQREAKILEASLTDALTGAGNRRKLDQSLAAEISRVRRAGGGLSAVMADLDFFKRVNDRYGHGAGDAVLARFAAIMRAQTRLTDQVARYGGEEFVVLLPHADLASAAAFAERTRSLLASEKISPVTEPITASFGVASLRPDDTADSLLNRADQALYRAKSSGRNRVETEPPQLGMPEVQG